VLHQHLSDDEKFRMWESVAKRDRRRHYAYLVKDHKGYDWKARDDPMALSTLSLVLEQAIELVKDRDSFRGSTQFNESFQNVKWKYYRKRFNFGNSARAASRWPNYHISTWTTGKTSFVQGLVSHQFTPHVAVCFAHIQSSNGNWQSKGGHQAIKQPQEGIVQFAGSSQIPK
jgi:hypothetical protein